MFQALTCSSSGGDAQVELGILRVGCTRIGAAN
jgi:hypothetical protein